MPGTLQIAAQIARIPIETIAGFSTTRHPPPFSGPVLTSPAGILSQSCPNGAVIRLSDEPPPRQGALPRVTRRTRSGTRARSTAGGRLGSEPLLATPARQLAWPELAVQLDEERCEPCVLLSRGRSGNEHRQQLVETLLQQLREPLADLLIVAPYHEVVE